MQVITDITESDRIAYEGLGCKNITLEAFAANRQKEDRKFNTVKAMYMDLKITNEPLVKSVKSLYYDKDDCVTRTIVIDGANVMHCGSPHTDTREGPSNSIPDVAALLSIMRYFVVRNFEVFAVLSRKYVKFGATNFKEGIDELVKNHLCVVVPHTNLDDSVALEFAAQINGVVLTSDLYRDHASECPRSCRIVDEHRLGIEWGERLKLDNCHSRVTNNEHDYVPSKHFSFRGDDGREMFENDVIERVYSFPSQLLYSISKERRKLADPEGKKRKVMFLLDDLITRGKQNYIGNVTNILSQPIHVPNETSSSNSDPDTTLEVPHDEQSDYIDYNPDDFEEDDW